MHELEDDGPDGAVFRRNFVLAYTRVAVRALNSTRNYINGELKKGANIWMKALGQAILPASDDIKKIVLRTADLKDKNLETIAYWWFNDMLPRSVVGDLYGPALRPYVPCSQASSVNDPEYEDITTQSEAWAYIQFVNYREKWQSLWSLKNNNKNHAVVTNKGDQAHCEKLTREAKPTPGKKPKMYVSTTENTDLVPKYTVTFPGKYCVLCGRVCTFLYFTNLTLFFPLCLS